MPNVFSIADDILIAGYNKQDKDHDETLDKVLRVCKQANLKLNKGKCLFRCTNIPSLKEFLARCKSRSQKSIYRDATIKIQEGHAVNPGYTNLPM